MQAVLQPKTDIPSFDEEILAPLQARQAAEAENARLAAVEATRQAEIARQANLNSIAGKVKPYGTYYNNYARGNCTLYVASRISVPNSLGNANRWGYVLGAKSQPVVGAIAWTTAGWAGHVAVVEQVSGDEVYISEMNAMGLGVIDYRWTSIYEWSGFIY